MLLLVRPGAAGGALTLGLALALPAGFGHPALAASYVIRADGSGDFATIQSAVAAAANGDTIALANGVFTGAGNRDVDFLGKAITIRSQSGDTALCAVDCQATGADPHRGFLFQSGEGALSVLEGITIRRASFATGAGIYCSGSSPSIRNCRIAHNYADFNGGGIWVTGGGAPTVQSSTLDYNVTGGDGGGIGVAGASITLIEVASLRSIADRGGGLYVVGPGTATALRSSFSDTNDNPAGYPDHGGGIYVGDGASLELTDCTVSDNKVAGVGGGLWIEDADVTGTRCVIASNIGDVGAAVAVSMSSVTFVSCSFVSNFRAEAWPALYGTSGSSITLRNCIAAFTSNGLTTPGVWAGCDSTSTMTLECTDVYGNTGGDWVGCIAAQAASAGNFSADPLFCNLFPGDFRVAVGSPCAPGHHPSGFPCGLIGALPEGCGPAILSIHPPLGGRPGVITAALWGFGFVAGATVKLTRTGQPDIAGANPVVTQGGRSLAATFDLTGADAGAWNVVVTLPNLENATLVDGFTIVDLAPPQLRVDVIGPDVIRTGYPTAYDLVLQNAGNSDALTVPLWVAGIPASAMVLPDFPLASPAREAGEPDWGQLPQSLTSAGGRYLALVIPRVPPGTTTRRIYVTVPAAGTFPLTVALTPPWTDGAPLRACVAEAGIVADVACMGARLTAINVDLAAQTQVQALNGIGVWAKIGWQCEGASSLAAALAEAEQALDLMVQPVEQQGAVPPSCDEVLGPRWREVLPVTVGGSIDPNDKFGNRGQDSVITSQQILSYSIRFENLSSALFPAQEVVVTDVLDPDLDPGTVSLGTISFGSRRLYPPPGQSGYAATLDLRPAQNLLVHVNALLSGSTLNWYFTSVDPSGQPLPPTAGFLPPNVNPPEGEGSVVFTIRPRSGLPSGTRISNSAALTFDGATTNTSPWINSLDDTSPASHVEALGSPLPDATFPVTWTADGSSADLRDFTVCVSEDGGPYQVWQLNTSATSAVFVPRGDHSPHTYAFYSLARDLVGNMEAPPVAADAQTLSTTDVDGPGPWTLALAGARPNPASGEAQVWFTLPSRDPAFLEVLDVTGRRVFRREVGSLGAGPHRLSLDPSRRLKSGLYFLRLVRGDGALSARIVLIR